MELTDKFFLDSIDQFKSDLKENKDTCIISYEVYGPRTSYYDAIGGRETREIQLKYFLWYVKDQGYDYKIHEENKQICDDFDGWCAQRMRFITIKLK